MEILATLAIVLAMIALGAVLIHRLNAQQSQRIASHYYTRTRPRLRTAGTGAGQRQRRSWLGPPARRRPGGDEPVLLLGDSHSQPVAPGTAVLRLTTTPDRTSTFDGAWWPRSRDATTQLPGLLRALTAHLGPIARVGLDTSAFDDAPRSLVLDGRTVRVDWSPVGDHTMMVTRGERDYFSFLLIPPQAPAPAARAAMAMAMRADHRTSATEILTRSGIVRTPAALAATAGPGS